MNQILIAVLLIGGLFLYIGCQTYAICCCNGINRSSKKSEEESLLKL